MPLSRPGTYVEKVDRHCADCRFKWGLGGGVDVCLKPLLDNGLLDKNPRYSPQEELAGADDQIRKIWTENHELEIHYSTGVCDEWKGISRIEEFSCTS